MQEFDILTPTSLDEALRLLRQHGEEAKLIAGGNSLVLLLKNDLIGPRHLISLHGVPGLDRVAEDGTGGLTLGALVTHRTVETSLLIRERRPVLAAMARQIASPLIRSRATIGGNLCQAHPQADPPPLLAALGARVQLAGNNGGREMAVGDLFQDYFETVLEPREILTGITIPPPPPRSGSAYLRFTTRSVADLPCVTVAVQVSLDAAKQRCEDAAIVLGAMGPTPMRAAAAEEILRGKSLTDAIFKEAAAKSVEGTQPVSDLHASAWYKREVAQVLVVRALRQAAAQARAQAA